MHILLHWLTVEFDSLLHPSRPDLHLSPAVSTDKSTHPWQPRQGGDGVGLGTVNRLHEKEKQRMQGVSVERERTQRGSERGAEDKEC